MPYFGAVVFPEARRHPVGGLGFGLLALTVVPAPAFPDRGIAKGAFAMLYGEPETVRFLAAVERLKRQRRRKTRETRLAKQRVRMVLRKMRDS